MIIVRDDKNDDESEQQSICNCGWDGSDSCVGDLNCSDLVCTGAVKS